jgi:hypothetical protein
VIIFWGEKCIARIILGYNFINFIVNSKFQAKTTNYFFQRRTLNIGIYPRTTHYWFSLEMYQYKLSGGTIIFKILPHLGELIISLFGIFSKYLQSLTL